MPLLAAEPAGLLFYISGNKGTTADVSAEETATPNFDFEITNIPDGAIGPALSCSDLQRLCWWAPGNIYSQRGTLSFFWRSRYPVGPTEFPIFRVGFADHSSWDMAWLRIDYNGHGFDAFVTHASLSRIRVSVPVKPFPSPNQWTHLVLAWDETRGIRFFINGKLAAEDGTTGMWNIGLDQFGPHSRIISPHNVQSDYNFVRGGDIDEIRTYDHMLSDEDIHAISSTSNVAEPNTSTLQHSNTPISAASPSRSLTEPRWREEWWLRYGWNRPSDPPPWYPAQALAIRKVEIHDAYDLKRWWWKACDGIRETTWPGVYNRSRLPGRNDYFQLPDWDCYVQSGKSITFIMPDESWNHLELSGAAWGKMELLTSDSANDGPAQSLLFERPKGQEKTVHSFPAPIKGQKIRFTNVEKEQPIGELVAYNVSSGQEPAGTQKLNYYLAGVPQSFNSGQTNETLAALLKFISGRFPPDERALMVGTPEGTGSANQTNPPAKQQPNSASPGFLPLVHILIPCNTPDKSFQLDAVDGGLDGIAFDLPALNVKPTHGKLFPLNIQVKDPLWPMRNMFDFTFSVKAGEAKTLWLDLRDRILPPGKSLYLTIAGAGPDFGVQSLEGARLRLIFKSREAARPEHELDRFTQARDSYAMLVEEHPHSPKLNLWNRFEADISDLMRVNPNHYPGRNYAAVGLGTKQPPFTQPTAPPDVPLWAFRQVELLGRVKKFVLWYVDNRQVPFGDFGGGISDDVDLLNTWPGVALMGCEPDKIGLSLHRLLEAAFANGMFTRGLPTIQADELHSYEEGIDCLGANLILDFGNPQQLERAMTTARGVISLTGINAAGHRHFRTSYYNGKKMATDDPWGCVKGYSYLVLQPGELLVEFNGNPTMKKVLLELADGLLAHRQKNDAGEFVLPSAIRFRDDQDTLSARGHLPWDLFWIGWKWSGDSKYLDPVFDAGPSGVMAVNANALDLLHIRTNWGPRILSGERGRGIDSRPADGRGSARANLFRYSNAAHFQWQLTDDIQHLEQIYADQIEDCDLLEYINTEGSLWIDRVGVPTAELQRARLGGVALLRNAVFPGHAVSWRFMPPANDQSVAVLVKDATPTAFKVVAYNLEKEPVRALMTGWNIDPGIWQVSQTVIGQSGSPQPPLRVVPFERSSSLEFSFAPRATNLLELTLRTPGTPYWNRPDLGFTREDVRLSGKEIQVRIHSLGSIAAPETDLVFRNRNGEVLARTKVPALPAPTDLFPKTADVVLKVSGGSDLTGCSLELDPEHRLSEITRLNNLVHL
jgi:hypothetical protein